MLILKKGGIIGEENVSIIVYYCLIMSNKKPAISGFYFAFKNYLFFNFVTFTEQFTNHFMNDLKKLAYFQVNL